MRRRQFARMIGAGIAGMGLTSTVSARGEGELPNEHVDTVRVHPFANDEENPITVPAGTWLEHSIGWIDTGEQNKSDIQAFLDAVEYTAWIDGEEIEKPEQYWGEIHWDNDMQGWVVWWKYHTPPKKPGLYTYTSELAFPDGLNVEPNPRPPGTVIRLKSYYEVVPR